MSDEFIEIATKEINEEIAPNYNIDQNGNKTGIYLPLKNQEKAKNKLLLYIWKIKNNNF